MSLLLLFKSSGGGTPTAPTVTTDDIDNINKNSARAFGTVVSGGSATVTQRGFAISTSENPTISDTVFTVPGTTGVFTATLTGLSPNTKYYVRAFATNSAGTSYGENISFVAAQAHVTKHFIYRIYDNNAYVSTWTKEVISEPKFKQTINSGPSQLIIELGRPFDNFGEDEDVKLNNKVECWVVNTTYPNGKLLYTGYISGYQPIIDRVTEKVEITVLGYIGELQRMILRDSSGNTTLTYSSYDPATILRDVIDKYRAVGGNINYTDQSIVLTNTVVSYTFNTNTIKECLDKIIELCPVGWFWRVDPDNTIYLQPQNVMADHTFTLGLEVERLRTFRRVEDLVNRVLFVGGGSPALFRKYENTSSQTTYGLYEKKIVDQRVTVADTAATISNREINSKKDPEIRSTYEIISLDGPGSRGYDIESIKAGQTLKIRNLRTGTQNQSRWDQAMWDVNVWDQTLATSAADVIQILSVDYKPDSVILEASSRLPQVAKRIEDIQRNLEVTQMVNNPSAPT